MAKKSTKIKTKITKKKVKTSTDLYFFTEQHPKLSVSERVELVDNLPELRDKINELFEYYNKCLNEAGVWRQDENKIDNYISERGKEQEEFPSTSILTGLWFNEQF
jgi:hypothetical protein